MHTQLIFFEQVVKFSPQKYLPPTLAPTGSCQNVSLPTCITPLNFSALLALPCPVHSKSQMVALHLATPIAICH